MFFTTLSFIGLLTYVREREQQKPFPFASSLLFAAASLTRPDGVLFGCVAGSFLLADVVKGRRKLSALLVWSTPLTLVVATHLLWSHRYYGYWLPNTFYAKVNGLWWKQAIEYFSLFHHDYGIGWFLPLILVPLFLGNGFVHWIFFVTLIVYLGFIGCIGGDRFEFRFLVHVFPYGYWLILEGLLLLSELPLGNQVNPKAGPCLAWVIVLLWVATTHGASSKPVVGSIRHGISDIVGIGEYASRRALEGKTLRRLIDKGLLPRDVKLAVTGAGAVPYYTMWPTMDVLGLNDVVVAHTPIKKHGVIAHEKVAPTAAIRARGIELFDAADHIVWNNPGRHEHCANDAGCWKSLSAGGVWLNFVTFLGDEEFQRRFVSPRVVIGEIR